MCQKKINLSYCIALKQCGVRLPSVWSCTRCISLFVFHARISHSKTVKQQQGVSDAKGTDAKYALLIQDNIRWASRLTVET